MLSWHSSESGIHLGQAVRTAAGVVCVALRENVEARGVMRVITVEDWNQDRCIEEGLHCLSTQIIDVAFVPDPVEHVVMVQWSAWSAASPEDGTAEEQANFFAGAVAALR